MGMLVGTSQANLLHGKQLKLPGWCSGDFNFNRKGPLFLESRGDMVLSYLHWEISAWANITLLNNTPLTFWCAMMLPKSYSQDFLNNPSSYCIVSSVRLSLKVHRASASDSASPLDTSIQRIARNENCKSQITIDYGVYIMYVVCT